MDRPDADIKMCCEAIENKLEKPYLLLQLPIRENGKLTGKSLFNKNIIKIEFSVFRYN